MRRARIGRGVELGRILAPRAPRRRRRWRSLWLLATSVVWVTRRPPDVDADRADDGARRRTAGRRGAALRRLRGPDRDRTLDAARSRRPGRRSRSTRCSRVRRSAGSAGRAGIRPARPVRAARAHRAPDQGDRRRGPGDRAHDRHRDGIGALAPRARAAGRRRCAAARPDRRPVVEANGRGSSVPAWSWSARSSCVAAQIGGDAEDASGVDRSRHSRSRSAARSLLGTAAGRMRRSLAQLPTPAGCRGRAPLARRPGAPRAERAARAAPPGVGEALRPAPRVRGRVRARRPFRRPRCRSARRTITSRGARTAVAGAGCGSGTRGSDHRDGAGTRPSPRSSGSSGAAISGYLLVALAGFDNGIALAVAAILARPAALEPLDARRVDPGPVHDPHRHRDRAPLPHADRGARRATRPSTGTTSPSTTASRDRIAAYRVREEHVPPRPPGPDRRRGRDAATRLRPEPQVMRSSFL